MLYLKLRNFFMVLITICFLAGIFISIYQSEYFFAAQFSIIVLFVAYLSKSNTILTRVDDDGFIVSFFIFSKKILFKDISTLEKIETNTMHTPRNISEFYFKVGKYIGFMTCFETSSNGYEIIKNRRNL